ncbi:MAG: DUF1080 domain-containing protein [Pirellulales bacterium]|jgi:hypothetical protein|nr:DUF1080 domain-containing protein [Pirellulales bacterium]MBL7194619.1 DUF1080 domain-containing protein [Pirellulales bacterium]
MTQKRTGAGLWSIVALAAVALVAIPAWAADDEDGFEVLFDGTSMDGWKANENLDSWKLVDGEIVCRGDRSHLFYVGDADSPAEFKNFHFKAEVMTKPGANSGIFFHTEWQDEGWPAKGYEMQVNNSQGDPVRTGSIYYFVKNFTPPAEDNEWFTQELIVKGKAMTVIVDGKVLFEYVEPEGATGAAPGGGGDHKLSSGTFALQAHDPGSEVHYRNIRVKRLP